jgi:hypothetical protein
MAQSNKISVYLEVGQKRTFAGAVGWPGWCRSGRDEGSALQALLDYGPRYALVLRNARLGFKAPGDVSSFVVSERIKGNATTDFGAPGIAPSIDAAQVKAEEVHSFEKIVNACWRAFDKSMKTAGGLSLRTGSRGGGRQLEGIVEHVLMANEGYLNSVGWKFQRGEQGDLDQQLEETRQAVLKALGASARGEIPAKGPRGGTRWTARYFVRRVAWHILDHTWEIEDRVASE